jgi:hypothetical protein
MILKVTIRTVIWSFSLAVAACATVEKPLPVSENDAAVGWGRMTLYVTQHTPANSPTYASRCLGYIGLTMYECVVHSNPSYSSLSNVLNGLDSLPVPEAGQDYSWVLAMNAGQATILRSIYNQTSDANKAKIDSLEEAYYDRFARGLDEATARRSVAFGAAVAKRIFGWSLNDGGHRGYLANFDKKLRLPSDPGCWEPPLYGQSFSHYPLHPHWGRNRTFLIQNSSLETPPMTRYDSLPGSGYEKLFRDVYDKNRILTQEEKEIALWWGDDPGETFTPAGHSYYLALTVLDKTDAPLIACGETCARVGIAVADAFINCWKWKYIYSSERPSSYISKRIDNRWESFWPDPPFPAFPSGHATQAAAVAEVMTDLWGASFELTDDAHKNRARDDFRNVDFKPRHYHSFWQIAEETALSRFYGGIHTAQDNNAGLKQGKRIGANVNALPWRKGPVLANY